MSWPYPNDEYPEGYFLAHGVEPTRVERGHFEPNAFARRHGAAILHYRHNTAFWVDNALFSDGTRGRAGWTGQNDWRRPLNNIGDAWRSGTMLRPVSWRWGRLDVRDDDIAFVDEPEKPAVDLNSRTGAIDADLYHDAQIKKIVDTAVGAAALWSLLVKGEWEREHDYVSHTHDEAASIVRDIRGLGETFGDVLWLEIDWDDCRGAYDALEKHLQRLGWRRHGAGVTSKAY